MNLSKTEPKNYNINCSSGYYLSNDNTTCKKCSVNNCEKCNDDNGKNNICISCLKPFNPIYENNIIKFCEHICSITDDNSCLSYDKFNKCSSCEKGYKLKDGKCFTNYSFKVIYNTQKLNETIPLINANYTKDIMEMIINDEKIIPKNNYTFTKIGEQIVYFLIRDIESTEYMFYNITYMTSIIFTNCFNT